MMRYVGNVHYGGALLVRVGNEKPRWEIHGDRPEAGMREENPTVSWRTSVERRVEWALDTYPGEVVKRFYELQLTDKALGLSAQAFIAMMPMLIVIISVVLKSNGEIVGEFLIERFALDGASRQAVTALFATSASSVAVSWLAIILTTLSALSLARRLSTVFASIFDVPKLPGRQVWRALLWIIVQVVMITAVADLRNVWRESGFLLGLLAAALLFVLWGGGEALGLSLLVPAVPRGQLIAVGLLSGIGRIALSSWAFFYMPRALDSQAAQYGAIGVTFALFTLILAGVIIMLISPLMVSTWSMRHRRHAQPS